MERHEPEGDLSGSLSDWAVEAVTETNLHETGTDFASPSCYFKHCAGMALHCIKENKPLFGETSDGRIKRGLFWKGYKVIFVREGPVSVGILTSAAMELLSGVIKPRRPSLRTTAKPSRVKQYSMQQM